MGSSASIGNKNNGGGMHVKLDADDSEVKFLVEDEEKHFEETVIEDCSGVILSFHEYSRSQASKFTTDVFLAYDSCPNNFILSLRVGEINSALRKRGLRTFFVDEVLKEDVTPTIICNAIDESKVVLVFITEMYVRKVGALGSNISTEFLYLTEQKTSRWMLPIVMESEVREPLQWCGRVGLLLGGIPPVDFSLNGDPDKRNDELFARIIQLIGQPSQYPLPPPPPSSELSWANLFLETPPPRADRGEGAGDEKVDTNEDNCGTAAILESWFLKEMKIVPKIARKYTRKLRQCGVNSIDILKQALRREPHLLAVLNFDEDDEEDIMFSLIGSKHTGFSLAQLGELCKLPASTWPYTNFIPFNGHRRGIWSVIQLADGKVCTGSADCTIRIWDIENVNVSNPGHSCVKILYGHTNSVVNVLQLRDGRLLSGGMDRMVWLWDIATGLRVRGFSGHEDSVFCLGELPDGRVCSGSADSTVRVWNPNTGRCDKILSGHSDSVQYLIVLHNGHVCTASWDHTIRIFDPISGNSLQVLKSHSDKVVHVVQLRSGLLCSSSIDCTIRVWTWITPDKVAPTPTKVLRGHTLNARWVVQLPDSNKICSCSKDRTLRIWDLTSGRTEQVLTGHADYVRCLGLLSDGRLLSGSDDCTVRIWS